MVEYLVEKKWRVAGRSRARDAVEVLHSVMGSPRVRAAVNAVIKKHGFELLAEGGSTRTSLTAIKKGAGNVDR